MLFVWVILIIGLLVTVVMAINIGVVDIDAKTIFQIIRGKITKSDEILANY